MSLFVKMLIERSVRAALAAFAGVVSVAAANPNVSVPTIKAAAVAGVAAAVSAVITVISQAVGDPSSGSFISSAPPTK